MRGLGYFDTQEDAAVAYDTEARKVGLPRPLSAILSAWVHLCPAAHAGTSFFKVVKSFKLPCCSFSLPEHHTMA